MLEGGQSAPMFIYIAYVVTIPQNDVCAFKPCLQYILELKITIRPPQPIISVPNISPSEKFKKIINARGWS